MFGGVGAVFLASLMAGGPQSCDAADPPGVASGALIVISVCLATAAGAHFAAHRVRPSRKVLVGVLGGVVVGVIWSVVSALSFLLLTYPLDCSS